MFVRPVVERASAFRVERSNVVEILRVFFMVKFAIFTDPCNSELMALGGHIGSIHSSDLTWVDQAGCDTEEG